MNNADFKITRISTNSRNGTHGVFLQAVTSGTLEARKYEEKLTAYIPFALTSEPPWRDNEPFVSCIPAGIYTCRRVNSPQFGNTFEVMDVPGREHILFHKGNFKHNTKGCFLVGEQFEPLGIHDCAVLASKKGYSEFHYRTRELESFTLEVVDAC